MIAFAIRRFITLVVTLFLVSILIFAVINIIPGDPAQIILGTEASPESLAQVRAKLGLDRPPLVRYLDWLKGVLHGDLGVSLTYNVPISKLITSRLLLTGPLAGLAILLTVFISIPLGVYAATHHNRLGDYGTMLFSQIGLAIPEFWIGILLILGFAVHWHLFPAGGFTDWKEAPLESLRSLLLPALALGLTRAAVITRLARSSMLEILREDYIKTAWSKGLSKRAVIYKHALRNAFISVLTILGLQMGYLLAGTIIIETVFYLPGMGRLVMHAIYQRDLPVVQGVVLFIAAVIVIVNFIVDILYGFLDPRIRYD